MTSLSNEAVALRTAIKANPRLELELKGRLSEILRAYEVDVSHDLLSDLIFASEREVGEVRAGPLPGPSLPPPFDAEGRGPLPTPSLPPLDGNEARGPLPTPSLPPVGGEEARGPSLPPPSLPPI